ncbi:MAG TPA: hypothetical protein VGO11_17155, partial [Chthoniobacteraceae bacterium]|nr:hypothetical protein [Chthoniobacteraceae bacterium]
MAEPTTPSVGGEAPLPPEHSLPSYHEPTPETHRRMSREEEAELALTRTEGTRGTMWLVTVLFLLTIAALPFANLAARLRRESHSRASPGADVLALLPSKAKMQQAHGWRGWWNLLPTSREIKAAEKNLEKDSIVTQYLLPRVQTVLTGTLNAGNEQVYPGVDGWLFYRPDVDYVIGPPFLEPTRLKQRARDLGIQSDPVKAIMNFHEQLRARGIKLIVVPVPAKPSMDVEMLNPHWQGLDIGPYPPLENPSLQDLADHLSDHGVILIDLQRDAGGLRPDPPELTSAHIARRPEVHRPLHDYLETDTHWRPETMGSGAVKIADALLREVELSPEAPQPLLERAPVEVRAMGDIAALLKLPRNQTLYRAQTVTIQQVQTGKGFWRPDAGSEILLLGDSFSNIYSLAAMGWGESAGLAEQLSYDLNRPLDCILQNSDGAFATRETLSRELARGRDRLAGKKVVIWEFAERELMFGNWKMLSLALGEPKPAKFYSEPP